MREIGVRDLKAQLSNVLREVEKGERVRVTSRGRPVADIVPMEPVLPGDPMEKLIAEGRVTPPSGPLPKNPPLPIDTGRSVSATILAEREEEH
jgi:prevent-host-death family protein